MFDLRYLADSADEFVTDRIAFDQVGAVTVVVDELVEACLVAGFVRLIELGHQHMAAFLFGVVECKVRMNVAGEIVIRLFRFGRRLPIFERRVLGLGGTESGFFGPAAEFLYLLFDLFVVGDELKFFLGNFRFDLIEFGVEPGDAHRVLSFEPFKLRPQVRHILLTVGKPILEAVKHLSFFGELNFFGRLRMHISEILTARRFASKTTTRPDRFPSP